METYADAIVGGRQTAMVETVAEVCRCHRGVQIGCYYAQNATCSLGLKSEGLKV